MQKRAPLEDCRIWTLGNSPLSMTKWAGTYALQLHHFLGRKTLKQLPHHLPETPSRIEPLLRTVITHSLCVLVAQSCPTLCDPMDYIAHLVPLSMEFSRQEYPSGLPFPSPGDLPGPRDQTCISYISCLGKEILYHGAHIITAYAREKKTAHILWQKISCASYSRAPNEVRPLPSKGTAGEGWSPWMFAFQRDCS